jgi:hypothetical protein
VSEPGPNPHEHDDDLPEQDADEVVQRVEEELDEYERWLELRRQQRGR